jgi:cytoskeletal protein RodZ
MKNPQFSGPKLTPASEYALIVGAGATAAVSIAVQQVAVASLPLTTLVALGLLNRYRLDQQLEASETETTASLTTSKPPPSAQRVTRRPSPSGPQPVATPVTARFSDRRDYIHPTLARKLQDKADTVARQQASLQKVGADLRKIRHDQGLTPEDLYQRTFIQPYTLKALEAGNLRQLPEPFYICSFLKKYADALGLDGQAVADQFPLD